MIFSDFFCSLAHTDVENKGSTNYFDKVSEAGSAERALFGEHNARITEKQTARQKLKSHYVQIRFSKGSGNLTEGTAHKAACKLCPGVEEQFIKGCNERDLSAVGRYC